ncbi:MAG: dienelactone hydrolase family protein [Saprospiraceae bacterium]|nr:dienelactone hydrolase family protein [Saprospiraceae bacterium]
MNNNLIPQEIFDLYDEYAHQKIDRRDFMQKLSVYAVGGLSLPTLLNLLMPDYKNAIQVAADDQRIHSDYIQYPSPNGGGSIKALLCQPKKNRRKVGGIVVVHENRGLNPYIEDVARRAAVAGFVALAPDALSPMGGYPGNDDEGRAMQSKRDRFEILEDFIAAYDYLIKLKKCNGRAAAMGFCFGGWVSNMMACRIPQLNAAVPFYGGAPPLEEVAKIKSTLLLHFAELDTRVNETWTSYEQALKEHKIPYTSFIYPKVNHGFHNDSTPRFDKEAAELAWQRTIHFLDEKLNHSN